MTLKQLRQLVDARPAQKPSDPGNASVVFELVKASLAPGGRPVQRQQPADIFAVDVIVGAGVHGPELVEDELSLPLAQPDLPEQRGPGGGQANHDGNARHER